MRPHMNIIAAVAANGVIGRAGALAWNLPADLRRFRELTMDHVCVVGRRTYESLPVMPGRLLVVLSATGVFTVRAVRTGSHWRKVVAPCPDTTTLHETLALAAWLADGQTCYWVIGGAALFEQTLPRAAALYLTHVHAVPSGDAHFPWFDVREWDVTPTDVHTEFTCATYQRRDLA